MVNVFELVLTLVMMMVAVVMSMMVVRCCGGDGVAGVIMVILTSLALRGGRWDLQLGRCCTSNSFG